MSLHPLGVCELTCGAADVAASCLVHFLSHPLLTPKRTELVQWSRMGLIGVSRHLNVIRAPSVPGRKAMMGVTYTHESLHCDDWVT